MENFRSKHCNTVLKAPKGLEDLVFDLPIMRGVTEDGTPTVTSFWKPNELELSNLLAGGFVALTIWGPSHPPLLLTVGTEHEPSIVSSQAASDANGIAAPDSANGGEGTDPGRRGYT